MNKLQSKTCRMYFLSAFLDGCASIAILVTLVVAYHDYYLSAGVPLFHVPECVDALVQTVAAIYYWSYLFLRHELTQKAEVFFTAFSDERNRLPTHKCRRHKRMHYRKQHLA